MSETTAVDDRLWLGYLACGHALLWQHDAPDRSGIDTENTEMLARFDSVTEWKLLPLHDVLVAVFECGLHSHVIEGATEERTSPFTGNVQFRNKYPDTVVHDCTGERL